MAHVALCGIERVAANQLSSLLRQHGHCVAICERQDALSEPAFMRNSSIDLIIVDVSESENAVRAYLEQRDRMNNRDQDKPMLLCVSRVFRGARFQLEVERKGARLIYVW